VTLVRAAVLISAPIGTVFDLARQRSARPLPWLGPLRLVEAARPGRFALAGDPGRWPAPHRVRRVCRFAETAAGTLLTDELAWESPLRPAGRLADALVLRRRLLRVLVDGAAELRLAAEAAATADRGSVDRGSVDSSAVDGGSVDGGSVDGGIVDGAAVDGGIVDGAAVDGGGVDSGIADGGGKPGLVVVGAALLDGAGRVLAAQRAGPPELAGRWEFPGGKVEPGESDVAALARECEEELGVRIRLADRLGADLPVQGGGGVLRVWTGRIVAGEPVAREHRALRWLAPHELDQVDWLPADRPLIELLRDRRPR
jgi:8-oxo-dGTP diphosphatase